MPAVCALIMMDGFFLSDYERKVMRLQRGLVDHRGDLVRHLENGFVRAYARELTAHFYPKWKHNEDYLRPIVDSYIVDLIIAPRLHSINYLWRYNYDDLDLLSNFYRLTQKKNGYFYLVHGMTQTPTKKRLKQGLHKLQLDIGDHLDKIWNASILEGKRGNVARRLVESVCGLMHDDDLNKTFGFANSESLRNLQKAAGGGKYRYLRRGRSWMALGTRKQSGLVDLRKETVTDLWGYQLKYNDKKQKVVIRISHPNRKQFFANVQAITEQKGDVRKKLRGISNYHQRFFERHRFANSTNWFFIDNWILKRTLNLRKQIPNAEGKIFLAHKNFSGKTTYLPKRNNFFWDPEKFLHCEFYQIWNPHTW